MPMTTAVGVNRMRNVPNPSVSEACETGPSDPSRKRMAKMRISPLVQNGIITSTSRMLRIFSDRVAR